MIRCEVKVDACKEALKQIAADFRRATTETLNYGIAVAEETSKALINGQFRKRTGNLLKFTSGSSTRFDSTESGGGRYAFFSSIVNYASYLEEGTTPHFIPAMPKEKGKWLKFERTYGSGDFVFAKQVHHKGNKAMPFMRPAAVAAEGAMLTFLTQRAYEITSKHD